MKRLITAAVFAATLFVSGCSGAKAPSLSLEQMILSDTIAEYKDIIYTDEYSSEIDGYLDYASDPHADSASVTSAISSVQEIKNRILNKVITFIDSDFEALTKKSLGITSGGFLCYGDIRNVTSLDLSASDGYCVTFLDDLSNFPDLTELNLKGSSLTDFSPLTSLTALESLDISEATASETSQPDLSFLASLTSLKELKASGLGLISLSFLEGIKGINSLDISYNPFTDYSGLLYCTSLRSIDVSGCSFSNMTVFALSGELTSFKLENGVLSSLSGIEKMTSLSSLDLSGTALVSCDALGSLTTLTELDLADTGITSAAALSGERLRRLDLSGNQLTEASFLNYLPSLTYADLSGNSLTSITLTGTSALVQLDLSQNSLQSLMLTGDFSSLSVLDISNNSVSVFYIDAAPELTELYAADNKLTSADFLIRLSSLNRLSLDNNSISTLPSLAEIPLTYLSLEGLPLTDTEFLQGLTRLVELNLWNTDITALSGLADKSNLRTLRICLSDVNDMTGFEGLTHVTDLSVYGMTDDMWQYVSALTGLESIYINRSRITYLNLHGMEKLRSIKVVTCRTLTDISRVYDDPSLEEYYLEYVDVYRPYVSGFPKLKSLTVLDGNVERVDSISELPVCEYINLSENEELDDMTFAALPSLRTLILSDSKLTADSLKTLSVVMNMGSLDLSGNSIRNLKYFTFGKDELVKLDLTDNNIKDFSPIYSLGIDEVLWSGNRGEYNPSPEAAEE